MAGGDDDKQDRQQRDNEAVKRNKPQQGREKLHREDFERVQRIEDEEGFDGEPPSAGRGGSNSGQEALAETMRGLRDPGVGVRGAGSGSVSGSVVAGEKGAVTSGEEQKVEGGLGVIPAPPEPREWTYGGGGDDDQPKIGSAVSVEIEEVELPPVRGTWSALVASPPEPGESAGGGEGPGERQ